VTQTSYNRLVAARDQLNAVQSTYDNDKAPLDLLLEAQRRKAEAEARYYRSLVEYATSLRNVHFEKGTSLEYHSVFLNDDRQDFSSKRIRRNIEKPLNYTFDTPIVHPAENIAPATTPQVAATPATAPQATAPQLATQPVPAAAPTTGLPSALPPSTARPVRGQPTLAPPLVVPTTSPPGLPTGSPIPTQLPADGRDRPVATSYDAPAFDAPFGPAPRFNPQAPAPAFAPAPSFAPASASPAMAASAPAPSPGSMIYPAALPQVLPPGSPSTPAGVVTPARTFAPAQPRNPAQPLGAPQAAAPAAAAPQSVRPTLIRLPLPSFEPEAPAPGQPYPTAAASRNNDPWAADAASESRASASPAAQRPVLPKILFGPAAAQP